MAMARSGVASTIVLACVVVVGMALALAQGATATNHVVGGNLGWHVFPVEGGDSTFYQKWANSDGPYIFQDTLEFRYTPGDTILRVNGAGFENCSGANALGSFSEGHTSFPLEPPLVHAERVYFVSADRMSCSIGLKFFVDVVV